MAPDDSAPAGATVAEPAARPLLTLAELAAAGLALLVPPSAAQQPQFAWLAAAAAPGDAGVLLGALLAAPTDEDRPLLALAYRLQLTEAELLACALAREVELDPLWAHTLAALQTSAAHASGPQRPTLGLVMRWLGALGLVQDVPYGAGYLLAGRALASGLLQLAADEQLPAAERTLALHPQLLPLVLPAAAPGAAARAARFGSFAVELAAAPDWSLPTSWQAALAQYAELLAPRGAAQAQSVAQLVLRAGLATEAAGVAACLGQALHRPVARIAGAAPMRGDADAPPLPPGLEAWLLATGALPLFVYEAAPGDQVRIPNFGFYCGPVLIALGADGDVEPSVRGATRQWRLMLPPPAERAAVWRDALGAAGCALDHAALGRRYTCGASTVQAAAAAALSRAASEGAPVTERHIAAAACEDLIATTHGLSALAQWIPCRGTEDAFVADLRLCDELDLVLARCRWREQGGELLGPAIRARYAPGVKLLFIGASGTGKTLAAQWIAERLGKPLYRVDLAAVSSKYIGETEKNLSQLLARAEQLDCVLLFDEADSMFGARTDVKQANDRFANTQTNYLLQRIEQFAGITVLTSNSKARFDDAFMRRLDHVIEFPLPRGAARAALWRAHLGALHALTDEQLTRLTAEVDLAGGNIRNIALAALLLAALEAGRVEDVQVAWRHVVQATALEYAKLGRPMPDGLHALAVAA
jgi:hypothetical protein